VPTLARPDGVELYWEAHGDGPAVVIANTFNLAPVDPIVERLAGSRRVITYEPRGVGRSTHEGPYDPDTGADDLIALLEEKGPAVGALGIGDGAHRALRAAHSRPDLLDQVVFTNTGLGRLPDNSQASGFAGSTEVLGALLSLMRRDYRSGLRSILHGSNQDDEEKDRMRADELAALVPQEAAVGYIEAWIAAESGEIAREMGDRVTIMAYEGNYWFPLSTFQAFRDALPEAKYVLAEDGPISRPAVAAEILLRTTSR
jgi:pimeloyl-ACP methyl ester carboxylesterase